MTVILRSSNQMPANGWDRWCACTFPQSALDPARAADNVAERLERALLDSRGSWLQLGRELAAEPSAVFAHAPGCATNASDLGLMLAWTRLVAELAAAPETTLVICDDPWLYRHLATLDRVHAGTAPALAVTELKLRLRGILARVKASVSFMAAAWRLRGQRPWLAKGARALLVYGHPASTADGYDAYFGALMAEVPGLVRILHVDAGPARVAKLARPGLTASLHAFGSPLYAIGLVAARWRPKPGGPHAWLVRRAAAREGGTAQGAAIAWQLHCQRRWLDAATPQLVAWPWENHGWERHFVGDCRARGVATLGYQHATIGAAEWNYHAGSNRDEAASLPDRIACAAPAYVVLLAQWGVPVERLTAAGSWRLPAISPMSSDPAGAVFVPLPANEALARQMLAACMGLAAAGWRFLVREHPMTPVGFVPGPGLERAPGPLAACTGLRAVLYAATTVGLEAVLAGLPVVRFRPQGMVANDICPPGLIVPGVDADGLEQALNQAQPLANAASFAFTAADPALWRVLLEHPNG